MYIFTFTGNRCSLQSIGLGGNDIHDEGAIHLAKALKTNTQLRSLGLGGNQIGKYTCPPMHLVARVDRVTNGGLSNSGRRGQGDSGDAEVQPDTLKVAAIK